MMSFGGGFGQPATASVAPTFGSFGAAATTSAAAPPPTFGGFGAAPASSGAPTFGGFGGAGTSTAAPFGSFGGAASTSTSFGSFGGGAATTSTTGAFSSGFGTGSTFGAFGGATSKPSTGLTFGAPAATGNTFGGFGGATSGASTFGVATGGSSFFSQPKTLGFGPSSAAGGAFGQPQPSINPQQQSAEALYNAVAQPCLFGGGDERDALLARWNAVQASWGAGKAFYALNAPPLALTAENQLCRFKTVGYSAIPTARNEDGLVSFVVRKKAAELSNKAQVAQSIQQALGNKPNIRAEIVDIKTAGQDASEVIFYAAESSGQQVRKIPATETVTFCSQAMQVQNFRNLGVEDGKVMAKVAFTDAQVSRQHRRLETR